MRNSPAGWDALADSATSWEAALWSKEGQRKRFQRIVRHLPLRPGDRVLDFGCGTGAFCEHLPSDVAYVGWDWSPKMRERARREHPRGKILRRAPDAHYEHVVCCGTFNLAEQWTHEQTWSTLRQLWREQVLVSLVACLYRGTDPYSLRYGLDEISDFLWREGIRSYLVDGSYLPNDVLLAAFK